LVQRQNRSMGHPSLARSYEITEARPDVSRFSKEKLRGI
jgi:hypothetical protein